MNALIVSTRQTLIPELNRLLSAADFHASAADYITAAGVCDTLEMPAFVIFDGASASSCDLCHRIRARTDGNLAVIDMIADKLDADMRIAARSAGADDCFGWPPPPDWLELHLASVARRLAAMNEIPQARRALLESGERFSLAQRGARAGVWDARPSGLPLDSPELPIWFSPEMKQLFGYTDDEFPNVLASWLAGVEPSEAKSVLERIIKSLETKAEFDVEYRFRHKNGEYMWISGRGQGIYDCEGQFLRITGSVRDITENRHVANALQASEAKWRSLVENAPDIITVVAPDGTIQFANRSWPGVTAAEMAGKNLVSLTPAPMRDKVRTTLENAIATGQSDRFEITLSDSAGNPRSYASRVGPIRRADGISALVIITTEITSRKQHEQELQNEQELLRKLLDLHERDRQLIAYEIHDGLAQQMAAALMHFQAFEHVAMHQMAVKDFDRGLHLLREAVQETRRLISGLRPPVLDELGVVAAIEYLINELRADVPEIEFEHRTTFTRLAPPLESAIFRIVQEALANIRTHSGSRRAKVELIQLGQRLRLTVRDWGRGFDMAKINQGRFGLQGIQQRGRLLGAKVNIDSRPGHGTSVEIDFPLILDRNEEGADRGVVAEA